MGSCCPSADHFSISRCYGGRDCNFLTVWIVLLKKKKKILAFPRRISFSHFGEVSTFNNFPSAKKCFLKKTKRLQPKVVFGRRFKTKLWSWPFRIQASWVHMAVLAWLRGVVVMCHWRLHPPSTVLVFWVALGSSFVCRSRTWRKAHMVTGAEDGFTLKSRAWNPRARTVSVRCLASHRPTNADRCRSAGLSLHTSCQTKEMTLSDVHGQPRSQRLCHRLLHNPALSSKAAGTNGMSTTERVVIMRERYWDLNLSLVIKTQKVQALPT